MMFDISAMGFRYIPSQFHITSVKLNDAVSKKNLTDLENSWKKMNRYNDFQYFSYDDEFEEIYGHKDGISILLFITLLTISLSCLGILGITTYTAETLAKEIGIRKVMGAGVRNIVLLLSKNLLLLLCVAGVIALPVSWIIGHTILRQFAYRIDLSIWILLIPFFLIVSLTLLTIGSQTLKTAMANPVKNLRTE
jgi:ABC-type antimicrobial peptide transport system permease subunit